MTGSLCSLGLSVNIQPLTSQLESHLDIMCQSRIRYVNYCMSEKMLPGPFQLAPALRTLHWGCAGPCPPS